MRYLPAFLALALLLSGCAAHVVAQPHIVAPVPVSIPTVQPMVLNQIRFGVIPGKNPTVTMDAKNYQNFQLNEAEILRWCKEENAIVRFLTDVVIERQK